MYKIALHGLPKHLQPTDAHVNYEQHRETAGYIRRQKMDDALRLQSHVRTEKAEEDLTHYKELQHKHKIPLEPEKVVDEGIIEMHGHYYVETGLMNKSMGFDRDQSVDNEMNDNVSFINAQSRLRPALDNEAAYVINKITPLEKIATSQELARRAAVERLARSLADPNKPGMSNAKLENFQRAKKRSGVQRGEDFLKKIRMPAGDRIIEIRDNKAPTKTLDSFLAEGKAQRPIPLPSKINPSKTKPWGKIGLGIAATVAAAGTAGYMYNKQRNNELVKTAKVEMKPHQQETQWTCSAACLKAVLTFYGIPTSERKCGVYIKVRKNKGAETTDIVNAAKAMGYEAYEKSFTIDEARDLTDKGTPIICDIQSFTKPGAGHYVVLVGIEGDRVYLMDPNTKGNSRTISLDEFRERWYDHEMKPPHKLMKHWGVVVKNSKS